MIASSGINSVAKVTQTDWDLSSSITGTVKRRPTSLESCKSTSPVDKKENRNDIDFPIEKQNDNENAKSNDDASYKFNKADKSHDKDDDLSQEIEGGNEVRRQKVADEVPTVSYKKIDSPSIKKRIIESARKSFSSKLKLPNSLSHLSPSSSRKTLWSNKLSLSQLEQKNNLFIRDGQQQQQHQQQLSIKAVAAAVVNDNKKINKLGSNSENNITIGLVAMEENAAGNNPPSSSSSSSSKLLGAKLDMPKSKKSLIPSFLSGSSKNNSNHIKIPSTAPSIKKAPNVVEKTLTKTGNKFRELYREKQTQQTNLKRVPPPPYRPPPTPQSSSSENKQSDGLKKIRLLENVAKSYEDIDVIVEEEVDIEGNSENISTVVSTHTAAFVHSDGSDNINNMLAKAEYSSNLFKNIPVRPRKYPTISHMENYCLFDPSVDFCNEKELMKKALTQPKIPIEVAQNIPFSSNESEEKIEDITFEDQTVYDITEHDERIAHHNYYEIDPELMEKEEEAVMIKSSGKKSKMSTSSDSTSTNHSSSNSNSTNTTSSSSDCPSLFNSVIETTHSSNVESTDDNDSNGYGKCQEPKINQQNVSSESIITVQNVVTCDGISGAIAKKKAPQLDRIIRAGTSIPSSPPIRNKQSQMTKTKPSKTNNKISSQLDSLKQSHSLPQLQKVIVQNRCQQQGSGKNEFNFLIDNTTTIQLRRPYSSRQGRPLSSTSDDRDSGFLSPATPPDCQSAAQNVIEHGSANTSGRTKTESTLLNQCDNIQQLIEVSQKFIVYRSTHKIM